MPVVPFTVHVPQPALDDLQDRLVRARWPDAVERAGWDYGTDPDYLRELVAYWRDAFDWRAQEVAMNRFAHFRAEVPGPDMRPFGLHFLHERGRGPDPLPLVLSHGWPDSFLRMVKLIPLLTDPAAHGGDAADAFDVVVPSLPGYGFSDRPHVRGCSASQVATLFTRLMTEALGYARFGAHGGDWGSTVTEDLARDHAAAVVGIHLTDVPSRHARKPPAATLSPAEVEYLARYQQWQQDEGAYSMLQGTKPETLAYGLHDSPVGLAGWIVEKFRAWSDCGGDVETRFSKDELLGNIALYWLTGTIGSSVRIYYEEQQHPRPDANARVAGVPAGFARFPKDIVPPPRAWAERFYDVRRWTEMPRGGHFAALEEPELLAEEIRAFFRPLR